MKEQKAQNISCAFKKTSTVFYVDIFSMTLPMQDWNTAWE
jgi:hypothetical protein